MKRLYGFMLLTLIFNGSLSISATGRRPGASYHQRHKNKEKQPVRKPLRPENRGPAKETRQTKKTQVNAPVKKNESVVGRVGRFFKKLFK